MPLAQLFFWKLEHLDPYPYTFQPINGLLLRQILDYSKLSLRPPNH